MVQMSLFWGQMTLKIKNSAKNLEELFVILLVVNVF